MRTIVAVTAALSLLLLSTAASAKDLGGRVGLGYAADLPVGPIGTLSAISARYWMSKDFGVEGQLGYFLFDPSASGADSNSNLGLGVSGLYNFVHEANMNFFGIAGLSFGQTAAPGSGPAGGTDEDTAVGISAGIGSEFFLQGLPNLGFTTTVGLSYANIQDYGNTIRLGGGDFAQFGIRYYFGGE